MGGTSLSSPLIAAYLALTGARGVAWPYANAVLLNDPQGGSNGLCASELSFICNSGPGYDGPTGAGSISGAAVAGAPGIGGPGPSGNYSYTRTATTVTASAGVYPNGSGTVAYVQYGPSTAYGQTGPALYVGAGAAPVTANLMFTGLTPASTYHYRVVAQNPLGTTYGYDSVASTGPPPPLPTVGTLGVMVTGRTTVTFTAQVNGRGTPGTVVFSYGTGALNHTSTAVRVGGGDTPVDVDVSGLQPNTVYSYAATATTAAGSAHAAGPARFITNPYPPTVSRPRFSHVKRTKLTVAFTLNGQNARTEYYFVYGPNRGMPWRSTTAVLQRTDTGSWDESASVWALKPHTTYYFQAVATNAGGRQWGPRGSVKTKR